MDIELLRTFDLRCSGLSCPSLGEIGWFLGRPSFDIPYFGELLPFEEDSVRELWRVYLQESSYREYLDESSRPARLDPQRMDMLTFGERPDDPRPWTAVQLRQSYPELPALLSTGAVYGVLLHDETAEESRIRFDAIGDPVVIRDFEGVEGLAQAGVMRGLQWGQFRGEPIPISLLSVESEEPSEGITLGMLPLLRYQSVCFDWQERALYLGKIGPCFTSPSLVRSAILDVRGMVPSMSIETPEGRRLLVVFDTGAKLNHCKISLLGSQGDHPVILSDSESEFIEAGCGEHASIIREGYPFDMVVGMETLREFTSFGWELNPFRLYFGSRRNKS